MYGDNLRFILCLFWIVSSFTLLNTHLVWANECEENEEHKILLCGDWTKPEINEIISGLIGDGEIHKIIKESENFYLLHTCEERTKDNVCMRGFVHVIERTGRNLVIRLEKWDWFSP